MLHCVRRENRLCNPCGTTDNKGNAFVAARLLTTKFPLSVIRMEFSARLNKARRSMDLRWVPRGQKVEADELSNFIKHRFREGLRVHLKLDVLKYLVVGKLMKAGAEMHEELRRGKVCLSQSTEAPMRKRAGNQGLRYTDPW